MNIPLISSSSSTASTPPRWNAVPYPGFQEPSSKHPWDPLSLLSIVASRIISWSFTPASFVCLSPWPISASDVDRACIMPRLHFRQLLPQCLDYIKSMLLSPCKCLPLCRSSSMLLVNCVSRLTNWIRCSRRLFKLTWLFFVSSRINLLTVSISVPPPRPSKFYANYLHFSI